MKMLEHAGEGRDLSEPVGGMGETVCGLTSRVMKHPLSGFLFTAMFNWFKKSWI
jgi:hypothetical protein